MKPDDYFAGIGWAAWAVIAILLIVILGPIGGCASSGVQLCGMKPVGLNDSGVTFVLMQCREHDQ